MTSVIPHAPTPHHLRIPHQKLSSNPNPITAPKPQRPIRLFDLLQLSLQPLHVTDPFHVRDRLARTQGPAHTEQTVNTTTGIGVDGKRTTGAAAITRDQSWVTETDNCDGGRSGKAEVGFEGERFAEGAKIRLASLEDAVLARRVTIEKRRNVRRRRSAGRR